MSLIRMYDHNILKVSDINQAAYHLSSPRLVFFFLFSFGLTRILHQ